ncbi:MAG: efflux RND transporter periplasmic adaptor subunit, partial [Candidatus Omnitrophica bacterium]|nr:efflux RND transporter periplasmic adaptor subunit [Candidatus Omnitrophota bacterium]
MNSQYRENNPPAENGPSFPIRKSWIIAVIIVLGGLWLYSVVFSSKSHTANQQVQTASEKIKYWTCSMHPQIKLPKAGQCPICGMDLIPVTDGGGGQDAGDVSLTLNETARQLAQVQTVPVQHKTVSHDVRLVGKVAYDETRLSYISAWVAGRIERLFVDFTGTRVRKGDHLIKLYSPELISAQEEYLQAINNWAVTKDSQLNVMRDTAKSTLTSAREKLRLLGIKEEQIENLTAKKEVSEHIIIYSPVTGTVINKKGFEGQYVKTGDQIYTIADLSQVWLNIDAYESDIHWLHYGQPVRVEAEAYPGEYFEGKIAFIDPFINEDTRTVKLRVNVQNTASKLKPGMFVRARITAQLGDGGEIFEPELAGRWICPMHPEIVKPTQAPCDICGMDLIPTREFGFADQPLGENKVLVIPASAPLITGKRAVVYVEAESEDGINIYEGREVLLGPRAGQEYVVLSGLQAGEKVVIKGNFKLDSAMQIQAKPSMMNSAGYYSEKDNIVSGHSQALEANADFLAKVMPAYFAVSQALSRNEPHAAAQNLKVFGDQVTKILTDLPSGEAYQKMRSAFESVRVSL